MAQKTAVAVASSPTTDNPQPFDETSEENKNQIRKDLRDSISHCSGSGQWQRTVTPKCKNIRNNEKSALRADFEAEYGCKNSTLVRGLYRTIAQEQEFLGIEVTFDWRKRLPFPGDEQKQPTSMLVVKFAVPASLRKKRLFQR